MAVKTVQKTISLFQRLKTLKDYSFQEIIELFKNKSIELYKTYYPKIKDFAIRFVKSYITGEEGESVEQKLKRSMFHKISLATVAVVLSVTMIVSMTAAWHNNVIETSGLVFDVEQWGIDSSVSISDELRKASPGKSGQIAVELNNTSDEIINVQLSVGKVALYNDIADMRKRLYFYIDDSAVVNGETTQRVYLNSKEDYSYTALAKQNLYIAKEGNGAPLMWEWVYDVVGYYFEGTVNTAEGAQITEFLRPVTYNIENATFNGNALATVDGKDVMQFVTDMSKTDGYEGTVTTKVTCADGSVYYPVKVDDAGTGIWIYCNNLSEIEYENVVDTALANAQNEQDRRFETMLSVQASQKTLTVAEVANEQDLKTALTDDTHNMVVLLGDVKLTQPVEIASGNSKIVDLGTHTLSTDLTGTLISTADGASLTLMNGQMVAEGTHIGPMIKAVGSDVALSGVDISGVADAIWIADQDSTGGDTRMNIIDCNISCGDSGVFIKGNGPKTYATTYLNIENSSIISTGYYGIIGNGTANATGSWGTDIKIKNSTVEGMYSAIYHPQRASSLLIDSSIMRGMTPVVIKGGAVIINSSQIIAKNTDDVEQYVEKAEFLNNGYSNSCAAVYVETGYDVSCNVTFTGTNIVTSRFETAILLFEPTNPKYQINVYGGTYSHDVSAFVGEGYECVSDGNGKFVVRQK